MFEVCKHILRLPKHLIQFKFLLNSPITQTPTENEIHSIQFMTHLFYYYLLIIHRNRSLLNLPVTQFTIHSNRYSIIQTIIAHTNSYYLNDLIQLPSQFTNTLLNPQVTQHSSFYHSLNHPRTLSALSQESRSRARKSRRR